MFPQNSCFDASFRVPKAQELSPRKCMVRGSTVWNTSLRSANASGEERPRSPRPVDALAAAASGDRALPARGLPPSPEPKQPPKPRSPPGADGENAAAPAPRNERGLAAGVHRDAAAMVCPWLRLGEHPGRRKAEAAGGGDHADRGAAPARSTTTSTPTDP